jgi:hypothetical protein
MKFKGEISTSEIITIGIILSLAGGAGFLIGYSFRSRKKDDNKKEDKKRIENKRDSLNTEEK